MSHTVSVSFKPQKPHALPHRIFRGPVAEGDPMEHASYSINGNAPDGNFGTLFWCYALEDAFAGALWCKENSYTNLRIQKWNQRGLPVGIVVNFG